MSDLYSVRIDRLDGPRVDMRVTTVHPDAGPPPPGPSFPLNLLLDLWSYLDRGFVVLVGGHDLTESAAKALAAREPWGPTCRRLLGLSFGVEQPVSKEEHDEIQARHRRGEPIAWAGRRLAGFGMSNGQHHVFFPGDEEAFKREAATLAVSCTHSAPTNADAYDAWPDFEDPGVDYDARLPSVTVALVLKDPSLLGFVRAGMTFATAMYF